MLTKDNSVFKLEMDAFDELEEKEYKQTVEVEILPPVDISDKRKVEIYQGISDIDERLDVISERVDELNSEIESLTNRADGLDCAVAVVSGIVAGIIDSVVVGEWDFKKAKDITNKDVNNKVAEFVKKDPRYLPWCTNTAHGRKERNPDRLESAIEFLEQHYHLPGDNQYQKGQYGITGNNHRLDDFCHHPTLVGMLCSIVVQFTKKTVYSHNAGEPVIRLPIEVNQYGEFIGNNALTKIMAGVINWFLTCAHVIANQKGHLMSDIATPAGVPGSLLSMLKELSVLPCFKDTMFSENIRKAYQNGIGTGKSQVDLGFFNQLFEGATSKFDKRTEMAVAHELKRQAVPIIINEALVRGFFFIRRFIEQMQVKKSINELEWKSIIPFKNRTIIRMLTISTSTFMAFDVADAAIRSGGFNANCILRINFVGVGRFAIAVGTDIGMGIKKSKKENERMMLRGEQLQLLNAKVFYKEADMWIEAENTEKAMQETYIVMEKAAIEFSDTRKEIREGSQSRRSSIDSIRMNDKEFADEISDLLDWGI